MQTVTVSLPEDTKRILEKQVAAGTFPSLETAVQAGASLLAKTMMKADDQRWITPRLMRRVKKAEKEPVNFSRIWQGKGSFTDFILGRS